MKLNRWMSLGLRLVIFPLIVFVMVHAAPSADEKKPEPRVRGEDRFEGKILAVYEKHRSRDEAFVIEDAFIVDLNGTRALVGKSAKQEGNWMSGLKVYIAWENIGSIVEADNVEVFNQDHAQ
jgi:hypothetical protein